ncbi:MAG TPA: hypothetical protein V6D22_13765 [Candidatus Obscuribacterales bacterium]
MKTSTTIHARTSFDDILPSIQQHFNEVIKRNGPALFEVETEEDLWEVYLNTLPDERQEHNCHCCKRFIRTFGSLASIKEDGTLESAIWTGDTHFFYAATFEAMAEAVRRGKVVGVALFKDEAWGTALSGGWTHFAITPPDKVAHKHLTLTPGQMRAVKREDRRTLLHGLADFGRDIVAQAATLLEAEALYRSEKVLGPVRFLLQMHDLPAKNRENLIWRAVAHAPVGFCQPRSTMIGTLLEDIAAGLSFEEVKRRFNSKMNPLQYQRPQAAPRAGNIEQAEKLVAQLGIEPALHRRFARLDEIQTIWKPPVTEKPARGTVFGHLPTYNNVTPAPLAMSAKAITWEKFARTVLPNATKIEIFMESRMSFCALVTATNADAPQILQWNNPFSWYVYQGLSAPEHWSLQRGAWIDVTGVALQPSMWDNENKNQHQGKSAIFILQGCKDTREAGLGLFPEILKSELHGIRATLEAYSRSRQLTGREEASANGIRVGETQAPNKIRVTTALGTAIYTIDRWD